MKEIGGYFNLELTNKGEFLHDDGILLNSCRNALEFVLLSLRPKRIWLPKYTCDSVLQPVVHLKLNYCFYSIDKNLEILNVSLDEGDVLLYTNYFGLKDSYTKKLSEKYGHQLIIDNAQSYYSERIKGIATIYSPRKFFGVPDGGIAYVDNPINKKFKQDKSYDRCRHLLMRYDETASEGYSDFRDNDNYLDNREILLMSELTKALLKSVDYVSAKITRNKNFKYLQNKLSETNCLNIQSMDYVCPMVYPYYTRKNNLRNKLIENKVYVATYWHNVLSENNIETFEFDFADKMLPLSIDQRYDIKDMSRIIKILK